MIDQHLDLKNTVEWSNLRPGKIVKGFKIMTWEKLMDQSLRPEKELLKDQKTWPENNIEGW